MQDNNFEKHIKDNLESAQFSWDKEAMWDEIESQLPEKKKRKFGIIFWLGGALIFSALVTFYLMEEKPATAPALPQKIDKVTPTPPKEIATTKQEIAVTKPEIKPTKEQKLDQKYTTLNKKSIKPSHYKIVKHNGFVNNQSQTLTQTHKLTGTLITENNYLALNAVKQTADEMISREIKPFMILDSSPLSLFKITEEVIPTLSETKITPIHQMRKNKGIQLLTYAAIGVQDKKLSNTLNQEELLELRKDAEKSLEAIRIGLAFRKHFQKGLFIQTGIEYSQLNEQLKYEQDEIESFTIESDTAYYYQSLSGMKRYKQGQINANAITTTNYTRYNQHRFFHMPILIGYHHPLKKLDVNVAAGPVLQLHQSYKGFAYADDLSILEDKAVQHFSKPTFYGLDLQVETAYHLMKNVDLVFGIHYRKNLTGFSINTNINQKHNIFSTHLGVRYSFERVQ